jgi:hypothetical protein
LVLIIVPLTRSRLAFGYLRTNTSLDASGGETRINGYSASLSETTISCPGYLDGIATFGWNTYDISRNIREANATAKADTDGTRFPSAPAPAHFNAGPFAFGPTARVTYIRVTSTVIENGG